MDERAAPRIALIGATGFIGRRLQHTLLAAGYALTAVVRPGSPRQAAIDPRARCHVATLDDRAALATALEDCDFVVYCAGAVRGRDASDFTPANVTGLRNIAHAACRTMPRPRLLLISSLAASRPQLSAYACSKREGERSLAAVSGLDWAVLRPPAVYGPGDREMRPLFAAIRYGLALRPGPAAQRLSLLHVDDLAHAVLAVLGHFESCRGGVFELDDGRDGGYDWPAIATAARGRVPVTVLPVPSVVLRFLAHCNLALANCFGFLPMLTPGKVRELSEPSWLCDNRALTAATGWRPQVVLREGVNALFASP